MKLLLNTIFITSFAILLASCGHDTTDRALSGAAIGGGIGALGGAGGIAIGAVAGGVIGAVTPSDKIELGEPLWR